jgi:tetratricopeptide (TPR) repeat protein/tRNA A-37 threonylcarbamoyl transferase component Bud32
MPDHSAAQPAADRNLLFGILALQMDFIGRDALIAAMQAWVFDKARPLGQILHDQGQLSPERLELLNALVAEHIRAHRDDPHLSLQVVSSIGSIREELSRIADADLQASLAVAGSARADDQEATGPYVAAGQDDLSRRYQILRPHAKGGLGEVFVAEDLELHREVALKEIQECHAHDMVSRGRFLLEAEVTGRLEHPGIVPVYGLGQYADGRPFYAMRFIHGDNLKEAIRRFHAAESPRRDPGERRLALRQLLGRFIDICNAVAYAHSRGVLHRDLKPGNIMLGKYGETLVVDWGLAKAVGRTDATRNLDESTFRPSSGSGEAMTQMGSAVGTPAYMSPEQAAGQLDKLGPASDIYSLGATLYALLTGQAPFREGDAGDVLQKVRTGDFLPPRRINADIPAPLEAICLKAMAVDPGNRYASCAGLAEDVEHWLADEPVQAYPEPWTTRIRRWLDRHRIAVAAAGTALHGLIWVTAFLWMSIAVPHIRDTFTYEKFGLPWGTELMFKLNGSAVENRGVSLVCLAAFLTLDCWVLWRLSRSSGSRVLRELWYGIVVLVPSIFLCAITLATILPYIKVMEGQKRLRTAIDDPERARDHIQLGTVLQDKGNLEGAIRCYRTAIDLAPKNSAAHNNLGLAMRAKGDVEGAIGCYRTAIDLNPKYAWAHCNLGRALHDKGDVEGAIRCHRAAINLAPKYAWAHHGLGRALHAKGDREAAFGCFRTAVDLGLKDARLQYSVGVALYAMGDLDGAIRCHRAAIDLDPKYPSPHYDIGLALHAKGDVEGAIRSYRTSIDLAPKYAPAHYNLGRALFAKGDVEGAIGCYRTAIDRDSKYAEAHCNLGHALQASGKFAEALAAFRLGHEIGSQRKDWRNPSAEWVKTCETFFVLNAKLGDYLTGEAKPTDSDEQVVLARLCQEHKKLYAAAARFFAAAFAAEPKLAENLQQPHRYNAACAAALAGCGLGEDVAKLDDQERARLRKQALTWLRADLVALEKLVAGDKRENRALVQQRMQHWQQDADFIGVRGDAISKLPELEREGWRKLWEDVEGMRKRAADKK